MVNRPSLDDLANLYSTDKGTQYPHGTRHGYAPLYERYLEKWRDDPIRMLEIGICMEYSPGGHSVRMWSDYFQNASIFTFDIVDMSNNPAIIECNRVKFYRGDQGSREDLNSMYNEYKNTKFNFILEDGSHQHHHQMINFGFLFDKIESGGYYILEDMSIPGIPNCCVRNDDTYLALREFESTGKINNQYILPEEKQYLEETIKSIEIYNDIQDRFAVAVITKK
jgi:cephalosporin hydroxylase